MPRPGRLRPRTRVSSREACPLGAGALAALLVVSACTENPGPPPRSLEVAVPATFRGSLPCSDCPSTETTLELRDDGTYLLERIRTTPGGGTGVRLAEMGRWQGSIPDRRIDLRGPEGDSPSWLVVAGDTLMLLEQSRRRARPDRMPVLVRTAGEGEGGGERGYLAEGLYRPAPDGYSFTPCPGPVAYPVVPRAGGSTLAVSAGDAGLSEGDGWLVRVEGWLEGDSMVVQRVESTMPGLACPGEPLQGEEAPSASRPVEPGDSTWAAGVRATADTLPLVDYEVLRGNNTSYVRARLQAESGRIFPLLLDERMDMGEQGGARVTWYFMEGRLLRVEEDGERQMALPGAPPRSVSVSTRIRFHPDGRLHSAGRIIDGNPAPVPNEELEGLRGHLSLLMAALQATGSQGSREGMGAPGPDSSSPGER